MKPKAALSQEGVKLRRGQQVQGHEGDTGGQEEGKGQGRGRQVPDP
jgi:hypothetical protein